MRYLNKLLGFMLNSVAFLALVVEIFMATHLSCDAKEAHQGQIISGKRIVYGSASSPFVFKVLVALTEKDLDFNLVETMPVKVLQARGQKPLPAFVKASPLGKIPAYQEGDWTIADSTVIMAYLDRKNPEKPLYPYSSEEFAKTLWFEKYGDEVLTGVIYHKILFEKIIKPKVFKQPADVTILQQAITKELPPILDYLEKELEGKEWMIGDKFTAADIAIGTHLVTLNRCGIIISAEKWPNMAAYTKRLFERPSFRKYMQ